MTQRALLDVEAACAYIDTMKEHAMLMPGVPLVEKLGAGRALTVTYHHVRHATIPELQWRWLLVHGDTNRDLLRADAERLLQGIEPPAPDEDDLFPRIQRNHAGDYTPNFARPS